MSDVRARVAEVLSSHWIATDYRGDDIGCLCHARRRDESQSEHVAAVLAEAGLLVDPDATVRQDGLTLRDLNAAYDRQRQELAEAHEREDAARAEIAEWRKVAGVSTPDEMRQDNADIKEALEAAADWKRRAEQAETERDEAQEHIARWLGQNPPLSTTERVASGLTGDLSVDMMRYAERMKSRAEKAEAALNDPALGLARWQQIAQERLDALVDAERRGAVAALREAATGLERRAGDFKHLPGDKYTRRAHNDIARWLRARARADRIEGEDRG